MMRTAVLIIAAVLSGLVAPVSMAQTRSLFDEFENLESTKALRKIEANGNAEDKSQTPAKPAVKSKPGAAASRTEPLPKTVAEPQLLEPPIVTPESAIESKPQPKTAPVAKAPRVVPRAATKAGTVPLLTSPASKPPVASSELDEHQSAVLSGDGFID